MLEYTKDLPGQEYPGPEIDWNRYEIRFMSKQIYKGFREDPVSADRADTEGWSFLSERLFTQMTKI
jgi:hypothetical protein